MKARAQTKAPAHRPGLPVRTLIGFGTVAPALPFCAAVEPPRLRRVGCLREKLGMGPTLVLWWALCDAIGSTISFWPLKDV
jgi:hypothetical protein